MSAWIDQIFGAQSVEKENIVRRSKSDVEKYASFAELLDRVKAEQFHLIETGEQYIIICNPGALQIHC